MKRLFVLAFMLVAAVCTKAALPYTITGLSEKNHIAGPKLSEKDLEGKVLFMEYWGIRCPPCLASLPHMQSLYKKYEKTGKFVMIGAHWQGRHDEDIKRVLQAKGVEYPIYQQVDIQGAPALSGLPSAILVDHRGEIIKAGGVSQVTPLIEAAIKAAPDPLPGSLIGGMDVVHNKMIVKQLVAGRNVESTLRMLEGKAKTDNPAGKEAAEILEVCREWIAEQKAAVQEELNTAPASALERMLLLSKTVPSQVADLAEDFKRLNSDPEVKRLAVMKKDVENLKTMGAKGKSQRKMAAQQAAFKIKAYKALLDSENDAVRSEAEALEKQLEACIAAGQG